MNEFEKVAWIKLSQIQKIGNATFNKIYNILQNLNISILDFFNMHKEEKIKILINKGLKEEIIYNIINLNFRFQNIDKIFTKLDERNIKVMINNEVDYPQKLKKFLGQNFPPVIYYLGNKDLLKNKSVAIIGKREASEESLTIAESLSEKFSKEGYNIVSGYAKGVDRHAISAALKFDGTTIIVLPYGIFDFKWYKDFSELQRKEKNSLIISQFYPEEKWSVALAMQRNSVILGLSDLTIAVEFDKTGGTYNAIIEALKLKIPIFISKKYYSIIENDNSIDKTQLYYIDLNKNTKPKDLLSKIKKPYMKQEQLSLLDFVAKEDKKKYKN